MPKIRYDHNLNLKEPVLVVIRQANAIIAEYADAGFDLTLRQLYYQFVSRDLFPESWADPATGSTNNERSYKKLGVIIADGRMAGLIDWDAITDRTRTIKKSPHWSSPQSILSSCAQQFRIDKWLRQPGHVEVFVEKDAMLGVVEKACTDLDVSYFACRGYSSVSALWEAGHERLRPIMQLPHKDLVTVLYLGDHDPSGIDMDRDVRDRLKIFVGGTRCELEVVRLALNMNQVDEYNPPPNPAKITDCRAAKYIEQFGESCWELDALDPPVIIALIRQAVLERRDADLWDKAVAEENEHRSLLAKASHYWPQVGTFLKRKKDP